MRRVGLERLMTQVQETSGLRETHDTSSRESGFRLMTQVQKTSGFRETHDTSSRDEWV